MNRQEAIAELKRMASTIEWDYPLDAQIAIEKAVEALSGPTPDPDTGLVPCGCGGKAEVGDGNIAFCGRCGITTLEQFTQEDAKSEWNRAMGWREKV